MGQHEEFMYRVLQPLSYEDVVAWLTDKWGLDRPCPYCGNDTWLVAPKPIDVQDRDSGTHVPPLPLRVITCENCAHTLFLSEDLILAHRNAAHRKAIFGE